MCGNSIRHPKKEKLTPDICSMLITGSSHYRINQKKCKILQLNIQSKLKEITQNDGIKLIKANAKTLNY